MCKSAIETSGEARRGDPLVTFPCIEMRHGAFLICLEDDQFSESLGS